jgi:DnaK suppressor protein
MKLDDLKGFQSTLQTRAAELERLVRRRDGIAVERSPDQLDEIRQAGERALAVSTLDREFMHLRDVRAALRRVEDGSFGICQQCEEHINLKRLAAVPWASLCIRCQVETEGAREQARTTGRIFSGEAA